MLPLKSGKKFETCLNMSFMMLEKFLNLFLSNYEPPLNYLHSCHSRTSYVSVNSKPDHSSGRAPGKFFLKRRIPHHRSTTKPRLLGQKNRGKTPPRGIYQKIHKKIQQKNRKHKTEIMENSTEMIICMETLKQ